MCHFYPHLIGRKEWHDLLNEKGARERVWWEGERLESLANITDTDTGIFTITDTLAVTTYEQKPSPCVESRTYIIE